VSFCKFVHIGHKTPEVTTKIDARTKSVPKFTTVSLIWIH
jgi:hypothetical protein